MSEAAPSTSATARRFALIGAAGFIAPRHFKAIADTGNTLVAAVDPHDAVGALDAYFPRARFFTEIERFDRFLEKLRNSPEAIEFVSIASPNYLHDAHARLALRVQSHAICEKPLVIKPWNIDQLVELEQRHGRRVFPILQLRLHPALEPLRARLAERTAGRHEVVLTYVTRRGPWYHVAWKGDPVKSGGLTMNIGVHFFDLLISLFGPVHESHLHVSGTTRVAGALELEHARVRWFLSIDENDLPAPVREGGGFAHRSLTVDGQEVDLSHWGTDLHTRAYQDILAGRGFDLRETRPSIELIHALSTASIDARTDLMHDQLLARR